MKKYTGGSSFFSIEVELPGDDESIYQPGRIRLSFKIPTIYFGFPVHMASVPHSILSNEERVSMALREAMYSFMSMIEKEFRESVKEVLE